MAQHSAEQFTPEQMAAARAILLWEKSEALDEVDLAETPTLRTLAMLKADWLSQIADKYNTKESWANDEGVSSTFFGDKPGTASHVPA